MIKVNGNKKAPRFDLGKLTLCAVLTALQSCMILDTNSERVPPPKIESEANQELSSGSSANRPISAGRSASVAARKVSSTEVANLYGRQALVRTPTTP